ncbi:lysosomal acid glucosylceramidase-like [Ptiloglossa arizonensis]|uniref:lysosomal acid glucosylceramidase-like n=1 Tax=Ptiloglossa arizonensis TaxID=3350558 RepID=UPI003F9EC926
MWKPLLVFAFFLAKGNANECVPRSFGIDRIVCVCNSTYCDGLPENQPEVPEDGSSYWYVSDKEGRRLVLSTVQFDTCQNSPAETVLNVDTAKKYQKIFGFGGAFTDSAGVNIKSLSQGAQDQLLRAYYHPKSGSKYTVGRIPIAGTDFSTRPYTYDDYHDDALLSYFSLAPEDHDYKIPYAQEAFKLNPDVKFISVAWSPPAWMKTSDKLNGAGGFLKKEYYQLYTNYIIKFLNEYKKNGLDVWAITTGNEPFNAFISDNKLTNMAWTPETMAEWVANNLGPTLAESPFNNTLIMALDDQRFNLPWYMEAVFDNEKAKQYIAGTATHWYADELVPAFVLDQTHTDFPDKFLMMTEACSRPDPDNSSTNVIMGSWDRGENYFLSIIEYMNHWYIGWMDWNIALNEEGGPTWINNNVDSPIIVNSSRDEFYKQPMYYALKHFSRFVDRDSVKVSITETETIKSTAFVTPSNEVVVVLYNRNASAKRVTINDPQKGTLCLELSPYSMNTLKYKQ